MSRWWLEGSHSLEVWGDLADLDLAVMGSHSGLHLLPSWCFALLVWVHFCGMFATGVVLNDVRFTD